MILTSVRDIAGRKQTEEELRESEERHRRQARELSLLYQVSTMLAEAHDPTTVFRTVVEAVAQTFGYALISAYLLENESLVLQHQVGHEQIIELIPVSQGVSGRVVRTRQPVLLKDVREDESFQDAREGITSAICVPVFDQGRVIGTLNVESVGEVVLAEADLRLLSALGEQVGAAVGRAQLYAQDQASKVRLVHQAFHDPLTGLANRALLMDRITHVLARTQRQRETVAVLFMDLDNFKVMNDFLGHETGDRLLVKVAERLRTCVRPQDTVARMGGDEFVALLEGLSNVDDAIRVAERIIREVRVPFVIGGHRLHTSTSVGIAINTTSGRDLLRAADIAMYRAKAAGQGSYEVFEPDMHDRALDRLKLETDLRTSLKRGELGVRYQPQVSLDNGKVVAVEALLRWQHPKRGLLLPRDFLPLAEQTGLIVPIGEWILLEACRQARVAGAPPGRRADSGQREPLSQTTSPDGLRLAHTERIRSPAGKPCAGDNGGCGNGGRALLDRRAGGSQGIGRQAGDRRFRHRVLLALLPQAPSRSLPQDRPLLRREAADEHEGRRDRLGYDSPSASPGSGDHSRGG